MTPNNMEEALFCQNQATDIIDAKHNYALHH